LVFDNSVKKKHKGIIYKLGHPASMWEQLDETPLPEDGGKNRPVSKNGPKKRALRRTFQ
jgi:hypothetical protein